MKQVRHRLQNVTIATALAAGVLVSGGAPVPAAAQTTTPAAPNVDSRCTLTPLELPLFGGTPAAEFLATPAAVSIDTANLSPVDEPTEATIRDAVANLVACVNTGEPRRAYAIFTPDFLADTYGDPTRAYLPAFERELDAAPMPLANPYVIDTLAIEGMATDGRVVIALTVSTRETSWPARLVLREIDGTWLIDAIIE